MPRYRHEFGSASAVGTKGQTGIKRIRRASRFCFPIEHWRKRPLVDPMCQVGRSVKEKVMLKVGSNKVDQELSGLSLYVLVDVGIEL